MSAVDTGTRSLPRTRVAFEMALRELLRRWPTLLFMLVMPTAYFLLSYLTSDATTTVRLPLTVDGREQQLTVLDRDLKSLYLAVLGISVTSAFAALTVLRGTLDSARRLRLVGFRPRQLLTARLAVLGLITLLSTAVFVGILVPLVDVRQIPLVALSLAEIGIIGVALGALLGVLFDREFEPAMLIVGIAGAQLAVGRSEGGAGAERYLLFTPAVDALKASGLAGSSAVAPSLARGALHAVVLLGLAFVVWSRRTRIGRHGP